MTFVINHFRKPRRSFTMGEKIKIVNSITRKAHNGMTVAEAARTEGIRLNVYYRWRTSLYCKAEESSPEVSTVPKPVYSDFDVIKKFFESAPAGSILLVKK